MGFVLQISIKLIIFSWLRSCRIRNSLNAVQVNLCQKLLFLHQLTHNMTTDFSWNHHENYERRTCSDHVLPMFCACSFHGISMNNLLSYCGLISAKITASDQDLPVPLGRDNNILSGFKKVELWIFALADRLTEFFLCY